MDPSFEISSELGSGRIAFAWNFLHGPQADRVEFAVDLPIEPRGVNRLAVFELEHDVEACWSDERWAADEQVVENCAQRVDIREAQIMIVMVLDLLGGHVGRCPEHGTGLG